MFVKKHVHVCMYVCMYECLHISMCMYVRTYECMYVCECMCMYVCMRACLCVCWYVYVCMYVCMYVCRDVSRSTKLRGNGMPERSPHPSPPHLRRLRSVVGSPHYVAPEVVQVSTGACVRGVTVCWFVCP